MSRTADRLFQQAPDPPENERAALVANLLSTLPPDVPGEQRGAEEWIAAIEERSQAAVDGQPGVSWQQVRSEIEDRFAAS